MIKQILILTVLKLTKALKYEAVKPGHCPYQPGEIKSEAIDSKFLNGYWINVFDRKELNDDI